jgi:hypothetical protein
MLFKGPLECLGFADAINGCSSPQCKGGHRVISFSITYWSRLHVDRALPPKHIDLLTLTITPPRIAPTLVHSSIPNITGIRLYTAFRTEKSRKRRSQPYNGGARNPAPVGVAGSGARFNATALINC